jgi:hypothetical protein
MDEAEHVVFEASNCTRHALMKTAATAALNSAIRSGGIHQALHSDDGTRTLAIPSTMMLALCMASTRRAESAARCLGFVALYQLRTFGMAASSAPLLQRFLQRLLLLLQLLHCLCQLSRHACSVLGCGIKKSMACQYTAYGDCMCARHQEKLASQHMSHAHLLASCVHGSPHAGLPPLAPN